MMWFLFAPLRFSLPVAVTLNRFLAPLWVFIFGTVYSPSKTLVSGLVGRSRFLAFAGSGFGNLWRRSPIRFRRKLCPRGCGRGSRYSGSFGLGDWLHMVLHRRENRRDVAAFLYGARFRLTDP